MSKIFLHIYFAMQKRLFPQIDKETFDALISAGKVLETDENGIKVVEIDDQDIVKIFRLKRVFSSAFIFPYAWRFKKHASQLRNKGIKTVTVKKIEYCLSAQRHLLTYEKISGHTIKELLIKNRQDTDLIKKLIKFIASLHAKGIYFRSLHFGNVIVNGKGEFALIDIADLKIMPWSLTVDQRIRNWKHLLKYSFEKSIVNSFGNQQFFDTYADEADLSQVQSEKIKKNLFNSISPVLKL